MVRGVPMSATSLGWLVRRANKDAAPTSLISAQRKP